MTQFPLLNTSLPCPSPCHSESQLPDWVTVSHSLCDPLTMGGKNSPGAELQEIKGNLPFVSCGQAGGWGWGL